MSNDITTAIVTIDNTEPYLFLKENNIIKFYVQNYEVGNNIGAKLIIRDAVSGKDIFNSKWKTNESPIFDVTRPDDNIVATTETKSISGPFTINFTFSETLAKTINISNPIILCLAIIETGTTKESPYSNGVLKNIINKGNSSGVICKAETELDKIDYTILYPDNYYLFKFSYIAGSGDNDSLLSATYSLTVGGKEIQKETEDFGLNTHVWDIPIKAQLLQEALNIKTLTLHFVIQYVTTKGYIDTLTKDVKITIPDNAKLFDESFELKSIEAKPDSDKGVNIISVQYTGTDALAGNMQLFRKDLTNTKGWELVYEFSTNLINGGKDIVIEDLIAEPGKPYLYQAMFYRRYFDGATQNWITTYLKSYVEMTTPVVLVTDDIFLVTKTGILRIAYNPELTQFKRNMVDQVSTTIGGAYPFVTRNGKQRHRTFTLGGLLSYNREATTFYTADIIKQQDSYGKREASSENKFADSTFTSFVTETNYTGLSNSVREALYEKEFRNKAMDFLYDDHIILFKSMQEGNIIVRLTSVSMTPNAQLNRDIYSFTSQAVEVMDNSVENCYEYFVIHADDKVVVYKDLYLSVLEYNTSTGTATIAEKNWAENNQTIITYQMNKGV